MKRVKYDPTLPTLPGGERQVPKHGCTGVQQADDTTAAIRDLFSAEELQPIKRRADKEGVPVPILIRVLVMGWLQPLKK